MPCQQGGEIGVWSKGGEFGVSDTLDREFVEPIPVFVCAHIGGELHSEGELHFRGSFELFHALCGLC